jgi:murein L,D-transpeptidase YcbB/YkuD
MYRIWLLTVALLWGTVLLSFESVLARSLSDRVSESLRDRITISTQPQEIVCGTELLCRSAMLSRFYIHRAFRPAWSTEHCPRARAMILVKAIHEAPLEGLEPEDYHLVAIEALLMEMEHTIAANRALDPENLADLDLLLTDAFLFYGSHLSAGRLNPETIRSASFIKSREVDVVEILQSALDEDQIEEALETLRPQHPGYAGLTRALLRYETISKGGGWKVVAGGQQMQKGDRGMRVGALRSRLIVSGDLDESTDSDHCLFDEGLEQGIRRFQKRHGLDIDGIVGPATLAALNVPVEERIRQIKVNMERWRRLPYEFGRRYILVNIADFKLGVVENDKALITMRVVVGRRSRPTPVFTGKMTYMELNPYWHIPPTIAKEDILPNIWKDPAYLLKANIRVFRGWKAQAPEINPLSIDWLQTTAKGFPFKLRQEPGPSNALGRIKFMFPNKFDVYLHDTPARALFEKTKRSSSSGCIRIEKPIELADYLVQGDPKWTREKILAVINTSKTQIVLMREPIAVHVLYWTAWVDEDDTVQFRDDIYGRDKLLTEALSDRPPSLLAILKGNL